MGNDGNRSHSDSSSNGRQWKVMLLQSRDISKSRHSAGYNSSLPTKSISTYIYIYIHISTVKPAGHASTERPVFIGKHLILVRLWVVNSGPSICSYQLAVSSPSTCQGPPAAAAASANLPNPRNLFRLG